MPRISGSALPVPANRIGWFGEVARGCPGTGAAGFINSVSFNPLTLEALDRQNLDDVGRSLLDRHHPQQRCDALNDPARRRRDRTDCRSIAVILLRTVLILLHRQK